MTLAELRQKDVPMPDVTGAQAIFVTDDKNSGSAAYRIENLTIRLSSAGFDVRVISDREFTRLTSLPKKLKFLYLVRSATDPQHLEKLAGIKGQKAVQVFYDVDDIIFDPEVYHEKWVSALARTTKRHRKELAEEKLKIRQELMSLADCIYASTSEVAEKARALNEKVLVSRNSLLPWMAAVRRLTRDDGLIKMVYASGTDSHREDFQDAWPHLIQSLLIRKELTLTILGYPPIKRREVPKRIRHKVDFLPPVKHDNLISTLSKYDINLVPLERNNPFVEAKSDLKYQHASLAGLATIATNTATFVRSISDGIDGVLVNNREDWLDKILELSSGSLAEKIAAQAHKKVTSEIHHSDASSHADFLGRLIAEDKKMHSSKTHGEKSGSKKIVWVLDGLPAFSGGHRNILRVANTKRSDSQQQILVLNSSASSSQLKSRVEELYGHLDIDITSNKEAALDADVMVATHHLTVDFVNKNSNKLAKQAYFVQDLEALFYPVGDEYLSALETLTLENLQIICSGPWIAEKISELFKRKVEYFNFPIDKSIYFDIQSESPVRDGVLFFIKPESSRRLSKLTARVIERLQEIAPGVKVTVFGGDIHGLVRDSDRVANLGKPATLSELADVYRAAKVGVVFSSTNPSLIPYEMMASGLVVVDAGVPGITPGVASKVYKKEPVAPDVSSLTSEILRIYFDNDLQDRMRKLSSDYLGTHPSEDEMANFVLDFLNSL